jgi:hypothetical protein
MLKAANVGSGLEVDRFVTLWSRARVSARESVMSRRITVDQHRIKGLSTIGAPAEKDTTRQRSALAGG